MCTTCGCGGNGAKVAGKPLDAGHGHSHPPRHQHDHDHHHHRHGPHPAHGHDHQAPDGERGEARIVRVERDILSQNAAFAAGNRAWFAERGLFVLNLVSSPGSGKTTLLVRTIADLKGQLPIAVIEGDQQTAFDAERIQATGVPAIQVNTGKGCHLDAHMVGHAAADLDPPAGGLLFIENVGNLVCPAAFDLGEAHKVVVLSVTEGDDKPLKYPDMFDAADLMLLNKVDLLPHVAFDVARCVAHARRINPRLAVIEVSATRGQGMADWYAWLRAGMAARRAAV